MNGAQTLGRCLKILGPPMASQVPAALQGLHWDPHLHGYVSSEAWGDCGRALEKGRALRASVQDLGAYPAAYPGRETLRCLWMFASLFKLSDISGHMCKVA